jgi:NAD(P)-dependent dehydrogenase (short-subunit alcohol dehydrogenase family)
VQLSGTSAVVSGGASGLGLATARRLLAAGASVVLVDLPTSNGAVVAQPLNGQSLDDRAERDRPTNDRVRFAPADVTDTDSVAAAIATASELAPLRVAVTCAVIATAGKVLGRDRTTGVAKVMSLDDFARTISVNLIGTFNVVRLAAAAIAANDPVAGSSGTNERGVIVCTASVAAYEGQIGQTAYAASKGGVVGMTLPLAREFAQHLIRVVSVAPGIFDTPMLAALPDEIRESLGDPAEFGALVQHIVENPMLNGEVIRLDGAIRMAPR